MAATTASAILDRFHAVLTSAPLNLDASADPFSAEGIAGAMVDTTFRVVHGGQVHDKSQSNWASARIDRIIVTVQKTMNFDGYQAQRALQDLLDEIERAIVADGDDHDYMACMEKGSRKITRKKDSDVIEASLNFLVDFDFNQA